MKNRRKVNEGDSEAWGQAFSGQGDLPLKRIRRNLFKVKKL